MLNIELVEQINSVSIELRKAFRLPYQRENNLNAQYIPVNFDDLVEKSKQSFDNIDINVDYESDSSFMIKQKDKVDNRDIYKIYIGINMPTKHRIDCLMHELAHVLLHSESLPYDTPLWKNSSSWEQENEANCFSRCFLLPKEYFTQALILFSRNDGTVDINAVANYFNVPEDLVVERGRDLLVWN